MRFDIKKLREAGFAVEATETAVTIYGNSTSREAWEAAKAIAVQAGVHDPGLQEYAIGGFMVALQRAQILSITE